MGENPTYKQIVSASGAIRYMSLETNKFVKASEVPEDVKATLNNVVIAPEDSKIEQSVPKDPAASADDVDDDSGIDEELTPVAPAVAEEEGMGFKMVDGKTVDIFDEVTPHTECRYVAGIIVPLSKENFSTKTDTEIINRLKVLKKI